MSTVTNQSDGQEKDVEQVRPFSIWRLIFGIALIVLGLNKLGVIHLY